MPGHAAQNLLGQYERCLRQLIAKVDALRDAEVAGDKREIEAADEALTAALERARRTVDVAWRCQLGHEEFHTRGWTPRACRQCNGPLERSPLPKETP